MITYASGTQDVDWDDAATVFERAPLGVKRRDPGKLQRAFAASYAAISVFDDAKLIGLARALSDGEYQSSIYDVVLLPEYQGMGIGKEMVTRLLKELPDQNIILYANPGREDFYRKFGFRKLLTGMGRFSNWQSARDRGILE